MTEEDSASVDFVRQQVDQRIKDTWAGDWECVYEGARASMTVVPTLGQFAIYDVEVVVPGMVHMFGCLIFMVYVYVCIVFKNTYEELRKILLTSLLTRYFHYPHDCCQ